MRRAASALAAAVVALSPRGARADVVEVGTTHALYHEAPTRTRMTVYTPALDVAATPVDWATVRAGYEADVVSGASVAVKAGPTYRTANAGADVVTTASVRDLRHVGRGGVTLRKEQTELTAGYAYATENDYRSHAVSVTARTDVLEHNTQLEIGWARSFDRVCDRAQGAGEQVARFRALESSGGCFTQDPLRAARSLDVDAFQASWSQAWTPVLVTQLVLSAQIVNGFQSNPYRSVILGQELKAQEHHPENRARESATLRASLYLRPLRAALRGSLRGYWDTWDVASVTAEAELEKYLGERLRAAVRGRFYTQSGALFWSDDYTGGAPPLGPKGQYFTGDRELSPFFSVVVGLRATYAAAAGERGRVFGVLERVRAGIFADVMQLDYAEFTLGGEAIRDARAYLGGVSLSAAF